MRNRTIGGRGIGQPHAHTDALLYLLFFVFNLEFPIFVFRRFSITFSTLARYSARGRLCGASILAHGGHCVTHAHASANIEYCKGKHSGDRELV